MPNAPNPFYVEPANPLQAFQAGERGYRLGADIQQRNLLRDVGQVAANEGLDAASNAALAGGDVRTGLQLSELSLDRKLKLHQFLGQAAMAADTKEKWSILMGVMQNTFGADSVRDFIPFHTRESAMLLNSQTHDRLVKLKELQLKERDTLTRERAEADKMPTHRWTPDGTRQEPIPGGAADPAEIAKAQAAKTTADPLTREEAKKNVARVELYKTQADDARQVLSDVAQMRELRKGVSYSGGVMADRRATVAGYAGFGGGQALQSKAVDMQLNFSEKTKGAITDREQAMFAGATPGVNMTDTAANVVLTGMEAGAKRAVERGKFFEAYMSAHRTLSGAQEQWDRFITDKPILVGNGRGGFSVNEANISAWKSYVGKPDSQPADTPKDAPKPSVNLRKDDATLERARAAIQNGAPRDAVIKHLRDNGVDPAGL